MHNIYAKAKSLQCRENLNATTNLIINPKRKIKPSTAAAKINDINSKSLLHPSYMFQ